MTNCGASKVQNGDRTSVEHDVSEQIKVVKSVKSESSVQSSVAPNSLSEPVARVRCGSTNSPVWEPQHLRSVDELLQSPIFKEGLGLVKDYKVRLRLREGAEPISEPIRRVSFAVKEKLEKELLGLLKQGTLVRVENSPWGTPVVPVLKGEKVRVCGDYTRTLNKVLEVKHHPLPTLEECFSKVAGGVKFSKIDIRQAYNNLEIVEKDQSLTTLNTHLGQMAWTRVPYGMNNSGAIFQETIDSILADCKMTCCRVDDILVSGKDDKEHLENLNHVIHQLEKHGLRCRLDKTELMKDEVVYLGHKINRNGTSAVSSKIEDLLKMPEPKDKKQLISFLSAVGYYRRYLPDLSTIIAPLDKLRGKNVPWKWTKVEQTAHQKLKELLASDCVLACYDPKLPIKVDTDASKLGLGAVISHITEDGAERPIEYASRSLSAAERKYSQIDKEALAIIWAMKRFHYYVYGRKFLLVTDHLPLVHIFGRQKGLPEMSANRISRWALTLMNYDFDIKYRKTKDHANCDVLSRFPNLNKGPPGDLKPDECSELFSVSMEEAYLDAKLIAKETKRDPVLSKVALYVLDGWPDDIKSVKASDVDVSELKAYWNRRHQLTMEQNCVTWGDRVIVPSCLRGQVLHMIHATHIGRVGMKSLARSYVWWPGVDQDIDTLVMTCDTCCRFGKSLPKTLDHPWIKSTKPWQRVHVDYAGEFLGEYWLLVVDSYSKWPEVIRMRQNTTAPATIRALRSIFSRNGVPCVLVSDQGPQFISDLFEQFTKSNGVSHILCPTYSPKSNGLVERFVQSFKRAMKKMSETSSDLDRNLANFLLSYRNTPHSTTGQEPSVRFHGRTLRSRMHQLRPSDKRDSENLQTEVQQKRLESVAKSRTFEENQPVWVQPTNSKVWKQAVVVHKHDNSPVYDVKFEGRLVKKHADSLKPRLKPVICIEKQSLPDHTKQALRERVAQKSSINPSVSDSQREAASGQGSQTEHQSCTPAGRDSQAPTNDTVNSQPVYRRSDRLKNKSRVDYKSMLTNR